MADEAFHATLIMLASQDSVASKAAIRRLYYDGYEVDWIADTCCIPITTVQSALNSFP